jgi:hypothetical protein
MRSTRTLRLLSALAVLAALLLGLAACGGGGSSTAMSTATSLAGAPASAAGPRAQAGKPQGGSAAGVGSPPGAPSARRASGSQGGAKSAEGAVSGEASAPPEAQKPREGGATQASKGTTAAPGPSPGANRPHRKPTRAGARATAGAARLPARAPHRRLERTAGAAAPFLVETGDNSIPTYGSEASVGQLAAAESALAAYLGARAAGEWGPACAQMSTQVQKQLALLAGEEGAGKGCPQVYAQLGEKIPASARADPLTAVLTALRVESPHAFALFYGPGEQQYMMPLEEEGGWKVSQLEPLPWPIGSSAG